MPCDLVSWLCGGDDGPDPDSVNGTAAPFYNVTQEHRRNSTGESGGGGGGGYVGDPMLYILVVLVFYSGSIFVFMIAYIRKQSEERQFDNDYDTFVRRVGFDEKLMEAKNKAAMRLKEITSGNKGPPPDQLQLQEVTITAV